MAAAYEKRIQDKDNQLLYNQQLQHQHKNNQDNKKFEAGESSKSIKFNYQLGFRRIGLNLDIQDLLNEIKGTLVQQITQPNGHHEPRAEKLNASKIPAVSVQIGSWVWASKHEGDLIAKIYYKKKKLVWEFICGSLKKKIEFAWSQISALNVFSREDKICYLVLELNKHPGFYEEVNYHAQRHTQWNATHDFTDGHALSCRRHVIAFPPRVLDEPLKKMLQCDNNLFNLSQKPFHTHHSPLFNNNIIDFTLNNHGSSSLNHQVFNTNHHRGQFGPNSAQLDASFAENNTNSTRIPTTRNESVHVYHSVPEEHNYNVRSDHPFGPNFVPPFSSYVGPFGQNLAQKGGSFAGNQVLEHNNLYNQIQDISVGPNIGADQDTVYPFDQMDLCIPDQLPGLVVMDTDNNEPSLTFDPTYKPFTEISHHTEPTNGGNNTGVDELLKRFGLDKCDEYLKLMAELDFQDQNCLPPSEFNMRDFNNGEEYGVNDQMEFQDNYGTHNLNPSGSNNIAVAGAFQEQ